MSHLLKDKNLSETPFRKEVLSIFTKYANAIPMARIEKELKVYNRITLYRTIKKFIEKGIIHEITISGERSNFAICKDECNTHRHHHQHIHFKCRICSSVSCVEVDEFPNIVLPKYTIDQVEIQAMGLCATCNA